MKPLKANVVVAQEAAKKKTSSGIILSTESGSGTVKFGIVMYIGPDVETVKVGDRVLPNWQMAKPISLDSRQLAVVSEDDILVVVD